MVPARTLRNLLKIRLRSERELTVYVLRTTGLCVAGALACDVVNQMVFFESWPTAVRSWAITVAIAFAITVPVSRAIGKTHLALFKASRTDQLTGLLNRRALLDSVDDPPCVIALIIVDIDRFKQVNDTYGHLVGDEVLRAVAHMMSQTLGEFGRVGRMGGEEFAVLVAEAGASRVPAELERFRERVAATPVIAGAMAVSVTISAGLAHRAADQTLQQLYASADRALYAAKAAGRNRIVSADMLPAELGPGFDRPAGLRQELRPLQSLQRTGSD